MSAQLAGGCRSRRRVGRCGDHPGLPAPHRRDDADTKAGGDRARPGGGLYNPGA